MTLASPMLKHKHQLTLSYVVGCIESDRCAQFSKSRFIRTSDQHECQNFCTVRYRSRCMCIGHLDLRVSIFAHPPAMEGSLLIAKKEKFVCLQGSLVTWSAKKGAKVGCLWQFVDPKVVVERLSFFGSLFVLTLSLRFCRRTMASVPLSLVWLPRPQRVGSNWAQTRQGT
jgi:hypothetical protein